MNKIIDNNRGSNKSTTPRIKTSEPIIGSSSIDSSGLSIWVWRLNSKQWKSSQVLTLN
jgi:hypothetical protein